MLLALALSFPTIVFTVLLGVVLLYWFFVILGALHIDALGASDGALEGAGHGGLDGIGHAGLEGAGHGGLEGAGHGGLEGAGHGGLEGAGHGDVDVGGGDGAGDGGGGDHGGGDHAEVGEDGGHASAFEAMRLRSVPATVVMSFVITFSWLASVLTMEAVTAFAPSLVSWVTGVIVLPASVLVSLPMTALAIRPLAPLFVQRTAQGRKDLVGKVCVVRTGSVDDKFGEATLEDGGAGVVVRVRVDSKETLGRGDQALIVAWDEEREAFVVAPMDELMQEKAQRRG